jgi:hypothetical protein
MVDLGIFYFVKNVRLFIGRYKMALVTINFIGKKVYDKFRRVNEFHLVAPRQMFDSILQLSSRMFVVGSPQTFQSHHLMALCVFGTAVESVIVLAQALNNIFGYAGVQRIVVALNHVNVHISVSYFAFAKANGNN